MFLKVKQVKGSATLGKNHFGEQEFIDFFFIGEIPDSGAIEIFDDKGYDLRDYIGKNVYCLIEIDSYVKLEKIEKKYADILIGKVVDEYKIPSNLNLKGGIKLVINRIQENYYGLKTEYGIFLLPRSDFFAELLHKEIILDVERFILLGWSENPAFKSLEMEKKTIEELLLDSSQIYRSIKINQLSDILRINPTKLREVIIKLVSEKKLNAKIKEPLIYF